MTPSKSHFVALLFIIFLMVNVQSDRIMDESSDCVFKGPCHKRSDCYERCAMKPFVGALCEPLGRQGLTCCCLS
ncbi:hypothetical protein CARUB_v10028511mg [Capsella rubella]|uniref:Knottin scorpion toxin-like domain-containing protein n=1 Tax=Capsella rubella TaxID=81985 RepID=R0F1I0_9BRAS|nr:putative defensin-like protein 270 [Capsella rubella]EOA15136.1 hypothetical protein CARUB_v10028511mg [Capsella rubella]